MNSCDSHRAFEPIAARPSAAAWKKQAIILNAEYWESRVDMGVSLNGGTPKTPQNDDF